MPKADTESISPLGDEPYPRRSPRKSALKARAIIQEATKAGTEEEEDEFAPEVEEEDDDEDDEESTAFGSRRKGKKKVVRFGPFGIDFAQALFHQRA
jgi:hypothetical protein